MSDLRSLLAAYLAFDSRDGNPRRQELRKQMRDLLTVPEPEPPCTCPNP